MVWVTIVPNVVFPEPGAQSMAKWPEPEKSEEASERTPEELVRGELEGPFDEVRAAQEGRVLELDSARLVKPTTVDVGYDLADFNPLTAEVASAR